MICRHTRVGPTRRRRGGSPSYKFCIIIIIISVLLLKGDSVKGGETKAFSRAARPKRGTKIWHKKRLPGKGCAPFGRGTTSPTSPKRRRAGRFRGGVGLRRRRRRRRRRGPGRDPAGPGVAAARVQQHLPALLDGAPPIIYIMLCNVITYNVIIYI